MLWKTILRNLLGHPWQTLLAVLGIALGVAIVIAIDLANSSARRAFEFSADAVAGRATHVIVSSTLSGSSGFPDSVYRYLLVEKGIRPLAPVVEGNVRVEAVNTSLQTLTTLHVFGVDIFAERPFRSFLSPDAVSGERSGTTLDKQQMPLDASILLARPNTVILSAEAAQKIGVRLRDTLHLSFGGIRHAVVLAGVLTPSDERSRKALAQVLLTDIGTAQTLLSMRGRLSRIDYRADYRADYRVDNYATEKIDNGISILSSSAGNTSAQKFARATEEQTLQHLRSALPAGVDVERAAARPQRIEDMARAFDLNLTALSLLALIVGMFIIYNTMTFSVIRRRLHLGILRALGVTRREVFMLVLAEAWCIGIVGALLGVLLGVALGSGLVRLTTQTINDLYFTVSVQSLELDPFLLGKGFVLGVLASLLAAATPAHEATKAPPKAVLSRSVVETALRARIPTLTIAGCTAILLGTLILLAPTKSIILSYGGLLPVIGGCALLVPLCTVAAMKIVQPLAARITGLLGLMAVRTVVASLSRTTVAIAALMVAVAATVGVGVMVQSFRATVVEWLSYTLNADLYISTPSLVARRADAPIDSALVREIQQMDGVEEFTTFRTILTDVIGSDTTHQSRLAQVITVGMTPRAYARFHFKAAAENLWQRFHQGAVIVSESFAFHHDVKVGSVVRIKTDAGMQAFPVAGVYYEYASDLGIVFVPREMYNRYWTDRSVSGISVFTARGVAPDTLAARIRALCIGRQELSVRSNSSLLQQSLEVFDRTFAITDVLRLLTIVVSFVGVMAALMALQLERTRELGVLRANGLTPQQLWGLVIQQTVLMGFVAGVLAIPVGLMLAFVLIFVINQRSFGWTLQFSFSPEVLLQAVLLAVAAALLAGLYPAWRMARTSPAEALREG